MVAENQRKGNWWVGRREEGPLGHCLRVESCNWSQVGYRESEEDLLVDERKNFLRKMGKLGNGLLG